MVVQKMLSLGGPTLNRKNKEGWCTKKRRGVVFVFVDVVKQQTDIKLDEIELSSNEKKIELYNIYRTKQKEYGTAKNVKKMQRVGGAETTRCCIF